MIAEEIWALGEIPFGPQSFVWQANRQFNGRIEASRSESQCSSKVRELHRYGFA